MRTESVLNVKIEIVIIERLAGRIQVSPNRWIDCKWDSKETV